MSRKILSLREFVNTTEGVYNLDDIDSNDLPKIARLLTLVKVYGQYVKEFNETDVLLKYEYLEFLKKSKRCSYCEFAHDDQIFPLRCGGCEEEFIVECLSCSELENIHYYPLCGICERVCCKNCFFVQINMCKKCKHHLTR
ncbi:MAG TPA: hypothetical protein VLE02_01220 [Nitrosarchaeum sp.]|nr:hypothetical protein [Nitrosarchaeum sp.]